MRFTTMSAQITLACRDGFSGLRCRQLWNRPILTEEVPELKEECCDTGNETNQYYCKNLEKLLMIAANTYGHKDDTNFRKDYANFLKFGEEESVGFRWHTLHYVGSIFWRPIDYSKMVDICSAFEAKCGELYAQDRPSKKIVTVDAQHLPLKEGASLWCSKEDNITKCRPRWILPKSLGSDVLDEECRNPKNSYECGQLVKIAISAVNDNMHRDNKYYGRLYGNYIDGKNDYLGKYIERNIGDILKSRSINDAEFRSTATTDFLQYCKRLYDDNKKPEFVITVDEDLSAPSQN
jgi:hypothetical protein